MTGFRLTSYELALMKRPLISPSISVPPRTPVPPIEITARSASMRTVKFSEHRTLRAPRESESTRRDLLCELMTSEYVMNRPSSNTHCPRSQVEGSERPFASGGPASAAPTGASGCKTGLGIRGDNSGLMTNGAAHEQRKKADSAVAAALAGLRVGGASIWASFIKPLIDLK